MANGELFDPEDPTIAAHRALPLGTILRITNMKNGRRLYVVVEDRGPFIAGRDLDLSYAAARSLGFIREGVTRVDMQVVGRTPVR